MRHLRCQHVRLSWLRDVYEQSCEAGMWEYAARAYLLHLVGCTILQTRVPILLRLNILLCLEILVIVETMPRELAV